MNARSVFLLPEEETDSSDVPTFAGESVYQRQALLKTHVGEVSQRRTHEVSWPSFAEMSAAELELYVKAYAAFMEAAYATYDRTRSPADHSAAAFWNVQRDSAVKARRADAVARMEAERNLK